MTAGISWLEEETGSNLDPCHVVTCRATSMEAEQMRDLFSCRDDPIDEPKNLMTLMAKKILLQLILNRREGKLI